MYILRIDYTRYAFDPTDRTRTPFTLVSAMRAALGCANAHVERADGTPVVAHAGRAYSPITHVPTGRVLQRRARRYPVPAPFTSNPYGPWCDVHRYRHDAPACSFPEGISVTTAPADAPNRDQHTAETDARTPPYGCDECGAAPGQPCQLANCQGEWV